MIRFSDPDAAGPYLPHLWSAYDPRTGAEQAHESYTFGGWSPFEGFKLEGDATGYKLAYPGDPPMLERSRARLREELIILFEHDWVAIIQLDGSFEVSRMD